MSIRLFFLFFSLVLGNQVVGSSSSDGELKEEPVVSSNHLSQASNPKKRKLEIDSSSDKENVPQRQKLSASDNDLPPALLMITKKNKKQIFILASQHTNPGYLRLVCKEWRDILGKDATNDSDGSLSYSSIAPFWKKCMKVSWGVTTKEDGKCNIEGAMRC